MIYMIVVGYHIKLRCEVDCQCFIRRTRSWQGGLFIRVTWNINKRGRSLQTSIIIKVKCRRKHKVNQLSLLLHLWLNKKRSRSDYAFCQIILDKTSLRHSERAFKCRYPILQLDIIIEYLSTWAKIWALLRNIVKMSLIKKFKHNINIYEDPYFHKSEQI